MFEKVPNMPLWMLLSSNFLIFQLDVNSEVSQTFLENIIRPLFKNCGPEASFIRILTFYSSANLF